MRNPKQDGSNLYDCVPQEGHCPRWCNQCFFNRGYYRETPFADDVPEGGIVRMNCGHDSNIEKEKVLEAAEHYEHVFFNTSIPNFDFPGPVVFTANAKEEERPFIPEPEHTVPSNLMAVRLRVSSTNTHYISWAVTAWSFHKVPVILTFMAYYDYCPEERLVNNEGDYSNITGNETPNYEWKKRHVNSYWCPKPDFIDETVAEIKRSTGVDSLVCGKWCKDCRNCETLYWRNVRG